MKGTVIPFVVWLASIPLAFSDDQTQNPNKGSSGKIFNVVRFPNDMCIASPYNGTCYTSTECADRGGTGSGQCANGYGVCCIFSLGCGSSTRENSTYLNVGPKQSFTTAEQTCIFTICKTNTKVCRIKLEFTSFEIGGPVTGTVADAGVVDLGGFIGDCVGDSFSVMSPGLKGSPVICGYNTGQHMFIDVGDTCISASFNFNTLDSSTTRKANIKVLQYICGEEPGGPPGCLQYFSATSGSVASFNFPTNLATVGSTVTHLSGQDYTVCFRKAVTACSICLTPHIIGTTVIAQASYGLAISANAAAAENDLEADCIDDAIFFYGAKALNAAEVADKAIINDAVDALCGRIWSAGNRQTAHATVCSQRLPFSFHFTTDRNEVTSDTTATTNEQAKAPGGIVGFYFDFFQVECAG